MMLEKRLFPSQRLQAKYLTPSLIRLALGERSGPSGLNMTRRTHVSVHRRMDWTRKFRRMKICTSHHHRISRPNSTMPKRCATIQPDRRKRQTKRESRVGNAYVFGLGLKERKGPADSVQDANLDHCTQGVGSGGKL